jgi:DNA-binding transcriptional MerR regulator
MADEPVVIPEKIYFKIGEVCELVGVQAHVLRYWETEFPMLSPQKNKSGQRSYRRRDVEMALKIKQLLYKEMFTIAGARKKLQSDARGGAAKAERDAVPAAPATTEPAPKTDAGDAPLLFDAGFERPSNGSKGSSRSGEKIDLSGDPHEVLKTLAGHLLELREMLRSTLQ